MREKDNPDDEADNCKYGIAPGREESTEHERRFPGLLPLANLRGRDDVLLHLGRGRPGLLVPLFSSSALNR